MISQLVFSVIIYLVPSLVFLVLKFQVIMQARRVQVVMTLVESDVLWRLNF
jgi:hypothetical protein